MARTSIPSLFGRFTTILRDHENIGAALAELEKVCALLEAGDRTPRREISPASLLERLRAGLVQHFEAEEGEAYFGAIVRDRPQMLGPVVELRAQHVRMLHAIGSLHAAALDGARSHELPLAVRSWIAEFRAHEAAETALLQEFFSAARG